MEPIPPQGGYHVVRISAHGEKNGQLLCTQRGWVMDMGRGWAGWGGGMGGKLNPSRSCQGPPWPKCGTTFAAFWGWPSIQALVVGMPLNKDSLVDGLYSRNHF